MANIKFFWSSNIRKDRQGKNYIPGIYILELSLNVNDPKEEGFGNHCRKKRKCFSSSVFYSFKERNSHFSNFYFVVCKCFQFGHIQTFVFWDRVDTSTSALTETSILYTDGHTDRHTDKQTDGRQADSSIPLKTFILWVV